MRGMVIFIKQKVRAFAVCLIGLSAIGPGNVAGVNDGIFGEFPVNAVGAFSVQACTPDAADAGTSVFEVVFDQQAEFSCSLRSQSVQLAAPAAEPRSGILTPPGGATCKKKARIFM